MFETERLSVRHFQPDDLDDFAALCADPRVLRYVGDGGTLPRSEVERWIGICQAKYAARGYGTSAVFERSTGKFVGYCGVIRAPGNDFDEVVYVFSVAAWGKGYATEVVRAMIGYVFARSGLERIYATIDPDNGASIHVAEKVGMQFDRLEVEADGTRVAYYRIERER
ncbi:MAG TPA: GNAT family N-acetyltransferase [Phototrophicaceae bacterium]|nr:GNAT family N-acetyltransferase [Phototrophicaceae bacterium]